MARDRIALEGLRIDVFVGVYPHEAHLRQRLDLDLVIGTDVQAAAERDEVGATIDYDQVAAIARRVAGEQHHRLIETIAERIAAELLAGFDGAAWVKVRIAKPGAVPDAARAVVTVRRQRGKKR